MFFALIASNHHHHSRVRQQIAANILLAAISMLTLVIVTILVTYSASGSAILVYAWLCALLINILHYYPAQHWKTKQRR
jgi:high-affinity K+ transport system ATPase subunit B